MYVPFAAPVQRSAGKLPLAFVPNVGQADPEVKYQAHDLNGSIFITTTDLVLSLASKGQQDAAVIRIHHEGARPDAFVGGLESLPGKVNYLIGSDPSAWLTNLPTYSAMMVRDLYPGIDLEYQGRMGVFEGIYYVQPGANPALIQWSPNSDLMASINATTGDIELRQAGDTAGQPVLTQSAPVAYQEIDGQRVIVPSSFTQLADGKFGFSLGSYDTTQTLIIDPTLVYSSYFGGGQFDTAEGIALDDDGNIYVTGSTTSTDFPKEAPIQGSKKGMEDAFVMKLSPTGDELIYSTFLGGSDDEASNAIDVASDGTVYLVGDTSSPDFPTKNGYDTSCYRIFDICLPDAFLLRLSDDGAQIEYSTYLGGNEIDIAEGVVVDGEVAYLTGNTFSSDFPTRDAYQATAGGTGDVFVTSVDTGLSGGDSLVWSTFLGGSSDDMGSAIALTGTDVVVTGITTSDNYPNEKAVQGTYRGGGDAFLSSLSKDGAKLQFSTYLGGENQDTAYGIAVNGADSIVVVGSTLSPNFPTEGPIQSGNKGGSDIFVTAIDQAGDDWLFSTYLGGAGADYGYGISIDPSSGIYLTGATQSSDYPIDNTFQAYKGSGDAFVAKLALDGSLVIYNTLLGGSDSDAGESIVTDGEGNSYVAGNTFSANFPEENGIKKTYSGQGDVFVSIITDAGDNPLPDETPVTDPTVVIPNILPSNPLFGSFKIASGITLASGETLTYTILLHNSSMEDVTATVVDEIPSKLDYVKGSVSDGGTYDSGDHTLSWEDVTVPATSDIRLTYDVTTDETEKAIVVNTAEITADGKTFQRSFVVAVGVQLPKPNVNRPVVDSVQIGDQDVLTDRDVTLKIQAHDDGDVTEMYLREWAINPGEHKWVVVKSSGWVDYDEEVSWRLSSQSGVHFVAGWVKDDHDNVSIMHGAAMDFASLLRSETELEAPYLIPYLVSLEKGDKVSASLNPASGNPDLYVWYPGNISLPDQTSAHPGTTVEEVAFTAPKNGTYLFLVYAVTDTTYSIDIKPAGGPTVFAPVTGAGLDNQATVQSAAVDGTGFQSEPLMSKIGFDPMATGNVTIMSNTVFLPSLRR